jgi:hypothetical protein
VGVEQGDNRPVEQQHSNLLVVVPCLLCQAAAMMRRSPAPSMRCINSGKNAATR